MLADMREGRSDVEVESLQDNNLISEYCLLRLDIIHQLVQVLLQCIEQFLIQFKTTIALNLLEGHENTGCQVYFSVVLSY